MTDLFTYQEILNSEVKDRKAFSKIGSFPVLGHGMDFMSTLAQNSRTFTATRRDTQ